MGRLMHDFCCRDASDMYSEILAKRVYELKETQEGVDIMCHEMEQIYKEGAKFGKTEGIAEGIEVGEMKKAKETAVTLAGMGMPAEKIAEAVKVSLKIVQEWIAGGVSLAR